MPTPTIPDPLPPCPHCSEPVQIVPVDFAPASMSHAVYCECQEDRAYLCYAESPEDALDELVIYAEVLESDDGRCEVATPIVGGESARSALRDAGRDRGGW